MAGAREANPNMVCSSAVIPRQTIGQMFADHGGPLFIPLLQRRYCWTDQQLAQLLRDVTGSTGVSGNMGGGHSFNRIIMHKSSNDGKCIILDGQQRLTTMMILLAALRDALRTVPDKSATEAGLLQTQIDSVLFPWGSVPDGALARELVEKEGQAYAAAALIPTYLDRQSFWQVLLSSSPTNIEDDRVLCAKAFFDQK